MQWSDTKWGVTVPVTVSWISSWEKIRSMCFPFCELALEHAVVCQELPLCHWRRLSGFDKFSVLMLKSPSIIRFEYFGMLSVRRSVISSMNMQIIVLFVELGGGWYITIKCIVLLQIVAFHTAYSIVGVLPFFSSLIGMWFICIRANPPPRWSPGLLCSLGLYEFCCSANWLTHASPSCVFFSHVSVINPMFILLSASSWNRSWSLFLTDLALRVAIVRYGVVTVLPNSIVLNVIKFWVYIFLHLCPCLVDVVTFCLFILLSLAFLLSLG